MTTENSKQSSTSKELGANFSLDTDKGVKVGASASGKAGETVGSKETVKETREIFSLEVTCTKSPEGNYRWEVEPSDRSSLKGAPWDANTPRAKLIDTDGQSKYGLNPGGIRFECRCAREDMIIENIEIKDPNLWDRFKHGAFPRTKEMVVEQYIREKLIKEGLKADNI